MTSKILRIPQLKERLGIARPTIYVHIKKGLLPEPIKLLGGTSSGWLESEINKIIDAVSAGKPDDFIKAMVAEFNTGHGNQEQRQDSLKIKGRSVRAVLA
jgi:prophage regulatory protein